MGFEEIKFKKIIFIAINIMILNKVLSVFNNYPELFNFGNEIYHLSYALLDIMSKLAVGIISAILFYFVLEFHDKKKNMPEYNRFNAVLLLLIEKNLEIFKELDSFKEIKELEKKSEEVNNKITRFRLLSMRIDEFFKKYKKLDSPLELNDNQIRILKSKLFNDLTQTIVFFKELKNVLSKMREHKYHYFKNSQLEIESLIRFNENILENINNIVTEDFENDTPIKTFVVDEYLRYIYKIVILYNKNDEIIDALNNGKYFKFVKLLD